MILKAALRAQTAGFFLLHSAMAGVCFVALYALRTREAAVALIAGVLVLYLAIFKRFDYLDPLVGFLVPWIAILIFSVVKISRFAVDIHASTYALILTATTAAVFAAGGKTGAQRGEQRWRLPVESRIGPRAGLIAVDIVFASLTIFNVAAAGFVPLLRGIATGDTGYLDFGIHGVYGFYLALANALAIVNLILYLRTGKTAYLARYLAVLCVFVLFVTRQNLISVAVESAVTYSLIRHRMTWKTIVAGLAAAGLLFSVIGSFRSGDIKELAGVQPEYRWIPEPVIWLYSYSYFNIANVDNLVSRSAAPYYDASSISSLVPSSWRPSFDTGDYLLVSNFNVSSYVFPVYEDLGRAGVFLLTATMLWLTARKYRKASQPTTISEVGTYSVLYFCASFSFFFNFWFYLPVIFQLVVFKIIGNLFELACLHDGEAPLQGKRGGLWRWGPSVFGRPARHLAGAGEDEMR